MSFALAADCGQPPDPWDPPFEVLAGIVLILATVLVLVFLGPI
jgi:hypothetical protein